MKKERYESPKFDFQEMRLMERVADVCWGKSHYAWFDADRDGTFDKEEYGFVVQGQSCNDAGAKLKADLISKGYKCTEDQATENNGEFSNSDVHENVNSSVIMEIYSK